MLVLMTQNPGTDHASLVRVTHFYPSDGQRETVIGLLKAIADSARTAPGCFGGQVCTSDQDPEAVVAISRWQERESMEKFHQTPDFTGLQREVQPALARPSRTEHFQTT
jgi:quinol monooxygenase YgiN